MDTYSNDTARFQVAFAVHTHYFYEALEDVRVLESRNVANNVTEVITEPMLITQVTWAHEDYGVGATATIVALEPDEEPATLDDVSPTYPDWMDVG